MKFRKASLSDIEKIINIEHDVFSDPWSKKMFLHELSNPISNIYIIEKKDQKLIGYIVFWLTTSKCHILNLAISQHEQGKKYSLFLMEKFFSLIRNKIKNTIIPITLEVRENNFKAIKLYEKLNFKKMKILDNYYNNGENAILMELLYKM